MPVFGYRRVDGWNTRWGWRCPGCDLEEDELRLRKIAQAEFDGHRQSCQEYKKRFGWRFLKPRSRRRR